MSKMIHTPGIVKIEEHSDQSATFAIEPLHSGYGMTLGNSLRRVLLSSISGAAITSFKVEGASHEFTTIPNVKEDIVEIILNLKGVRFRVFSDEPQTIRLSKKGEGAVTAKDIAGNADVEIVNPHHAIATIDNSKGSIEMDIVVEKGRGYRVIDEYGDRKILADMIAIDSIFSPVQRVRYRVENTRVGQMTDLDKLLITIETDGTITPKEAFEEASAILVNQYTALAGQTTVERGAPLSASGDMADETSGIDDTPALMTPIEDLNLSARTTNALVNNDIHKLKDLFELSDIELKELKGFGSKALDEVKEKMAEMEF
ncbi:DNA-directed RNA polymerase subunit alpha [Candidatus Parcubacteria bacterium]|nr:DNA-directed RNA polymerase subunit alpha [Candidatus Parcubacteria bacterium]